jgi:hypothetical protein
VEARPGRAKAALAVRRFLLAALAAAAACNSPITGTIQLTTGGETDTFTRAPAPVKLTVDSIDSSGTASPLASANLPTDSIDLGTLDQTQTGSLDIRGVDANNITLVHGTTVSIQYGALAGGTLPVFVQRVGELARMPDVVDARPAPLASTLTQRFVLIAGGSDTTMNTATQIYDFATFSTLQMPPTMPRVPLSLAITGTVAWLIDGIVNAANSDYGATAYDLSSDSSNPTNPPANFAYADVAGGATVTASDGSQFVVGGTRTTGKPSAAVLVIDNMGNQYSATLNAQRLGASATWVDGHGLVVIGGSATAAGVEVVGIGSGTGSPLVANGSALDYPPDPTVGAGAAALDGQHIVVAGGTTAVSTDAGMAVKDAGVRSVDLGCSKMCTTTAWGAGLPSVLTYAQAFGIDPANALVVGSEASGPTHVFRLTTAGATEVPLKIPRTNARAVLTPLGTIVVVGGGSNVMESYSE